MDGVTRCVYANDELDAAIRLTTYHHDGKAHSFPGLIIDHVRPAGGFDHTTGRCYGFEAVLYHDAQSR